MIKKLHVFFSIIKTNQLKMSLYQNCDHARQCDKCHLYYCANDELITCRSCFGPAFCSGYFTVKNQDAAMWIWFCDKQNCMNEARKHKVRCSNCKNNCIKHKKEITGGYLCRRCSWRLDKKTQRLSKKLQ